MIRVVVADDLVGVRKGLKTILGRRGIETVGEASSGPEAIAVAERTNPDVVLMDIRMPGGDGIDATRQITDPRFVHPVPVIAMTMFGEDEYLFGALEAGACGFVPKDANPDEYVEAIRQAIQGRGQLSHAVTRRVINEFARRGHLLDGKSPATLYPVGTMPPAATAAGITHREFDIIQALGKGCSDSQIASLLGITTSTVKGHLAHIRTKTGTRNRTALLVWAQTHGIVEPSDAEPGTQQPPKPGRTTPAHHLTGSEQNQSESPAETVA